jgi:hypothetical protein
MHNVPGEGAKNGERGPKNSFAITPNISRVGPSPDPGSPVNLARIAENNWISDAMYVIITHDIGVIQLQRTHGSS